MYCFGNTTVKYVGTTVVTFSSNSALYSGALYGSQFSTIALYQNTSVNFINNTAIESGGAIHISNHFTVIFQGNSYVTFSNNTADRYGGAIYAELIHRFQIKSNMYSRIDFKTTRTKFLDNTALRGSNVYMDIPTSCNDTCLQNSIVGINNNSFMNNSICNYIDTPPKKIGVL